MKNTKNTVSEKDTVQEVKALGEKVEKTVEQTAKKTVDSAKKAVRKAAPAISTSDVYVQYAGSEVCVEDLAETVKADFKAQNPKVAIHSLKMYIKPEDHTAYYVVNSKIEGKVSF